VVGAGQAAGRCGRAEQEIDLARVEGAPWGGDEQLVQAVAAQVADHGDGLARGVAGRFAEDRVGSVGQVQYGSISAAAVLVHAIEADLLPVGADVGEAVVAVVAVADEVRGLLAGGGGVVGIAVAIAVAVRVPCGVVRGVVLVRQAVAVVVGPVAELVRVRVDLGVAVLAVDAVVDVPAGRFAGRDLFVVAAEGVAVRIGVPGGGVQGVVLVRLAVAVVVGPVAELVGSGVDGGVAVVAVFARGVAVAICIHGILGRVEGQLGCFVVVGVGPRRASRGEQAGPEDGCQGRKGAGHGLAGW